MVTRNPNRASTIYEGKDGYWHGRVTVGFKDDGSLDRRHVMSKSRATVVTKFRDLEKQRDQGNAPKIGKRWTFGAWLEHWLEAIARPGLRVRSFEAYQTAIRRHLIPGLGKHRLDRLEPEHLERLYRRMIDNGASAGTAHQVHRTARTALGEAHRRGHVVRNVAALAKGHGCNPNRSSRSRWTRCSESSPPPPRRGTRLAGPWLSPWVCDKGEALALRWSDVDLDTATLRVRNTLQRPRYDHGCGGACQKTPGRCPARRLINSTLGDTKSTAGRRVVGLPDELVAMLKLHREEQDRERRHAGQLWEEGGWVFATQIGRPTNPNSDYHAWKTLLKRAGVRTARLHDARHTAATVLLVLGVPERTVMSVMGWSSTAMAARYQHVTDPIRQDVARRIGGLLWTPENTSGTEGK